MTTSFEPFTPANGSPGARRSPEWSWQDDDQSWDTGAQDPWAAPESWAPQPDQQQWAQQQGPRQQWPQESGPSQQPQWSPQAASYAEPAYAQPAYAEPAYAQLTYAQPAYAQPAYASPPAAVPAPVRERTGRYRPIIIGLVVVLVLVSGWQAFRVESMIRSSSDLASAVTAEQGRSQELEKQLATVFDPEGIAADVLPSVFRVRAGDFTGTAFAVGQGNGRTSLFTNYHVVEGVWDSGARKVTLERGNTRIDATIIKVNEGKDLALLRTSREIDPLKVAGDDVRPGQQVMVVGAPLGLEDSVTTGVISAYRPDASDGPTIQFDAPINPGNSGGPVVNAAKQVVGLATAKARDAEGIGLAIPIQTACETLGACGNG